VIVSSVLVYPSTSCSSAIHSISTPFAYFGSPSTVYDQFFDSLPSGFGIVTVFLYSLTMLPFIVGIKSTVIEVGL